MPVLFLTHECRNPKREIRRSSTTHESTSESDIDVETIEEHSQPDRDNGRLKRYTEDVDSIYQVSDHEDDECDDDIAGGSTGISGRDDESDCGSSDSEQELNTSLDEKERHPRGRSRVDSAELTKELIRRFSKYHETNSFTAVTYS